VAGFQQQKTPGAVLDMLSGFLQMFPKRPHLTGQTGANVFQVLRFRVVDVFAFLR